MTSALDVNALPERILVQCLRGVKQETVTDAVEKRMRWSGLAEAYERCDVEGLGRDWVSWGRRPVPREGTKTVALRLQRDYMVFSGLFEETYRTRTHVGQRNGVAVKCLVLEDAWRDGFCCYCM